MTVRFGGTVTDYTLDLHGGPLGQSSFLVWANPTFTVAASLFTVTGEPIGNVVTSRTSGVYEFDAPDGTTVLWTRDTSGAPVALTPRSDLQLAAKLNDLITHNPDLLAALAALVQSTANIATAKPLGSSKYPNDEGFLGDADGIPSVVGFDKQGGPADAMMDGLELKGMLRAVGTGTGFALGDAAGVRTAIGFDDTGQLDDIAKWAIVNLIGIYVGPDQPFVWPGGAVAWFRTDASRTTILETSMEVDS
jgi:hypothetical protein